MRLRIKEVVEMVLIRTFNSFAEAQTFISEHSAANEEFVVGCEGTKPAVYCKAVRKVYY